MGSNFWWARTETISFVNCFRTTWIFGLSDADFQSLASVDGRHVKPGDRLVLETPGGGGWGVADGSAKEAEEEE